MKAAILRVGLVSMFVVGCGLFFYGLSGLQGSFGPQLGYMTESPISGEFEWSKVDRYLMCIGAILMGLPIAIRLTRNF